MLLTPPAAKLARSRCSQAEKEADSSLTYPVLLGSAPLSKKSAAGGPTQLTLERAVALQRELLARFLAPAFQKKLRELAKKHDAPTNRTAEYREAFKLLVRREQLEVIPRYGFARSEQGVQDMLEAFRVFQDTKESISNEAAIEKALFSASKKGQCTRSLPRRKSKALTQERALALQRELLAKFVSPAFQKQLHELSRLHNAVKFRTSPYQAEFKKLVRRVQAEVIPLYGFEASDEGVEDMIEAFQEFMEIGDVFVNDLAIREALFTASSAQAACESREPEISEEKPSSKRDLSDLLRNLLVNFSTPDFQQAIEELKLDADCFAGRVAYKWPSTRKLRTEDPDGYYHLAGRAELALEIQQEILPKWGFEGSKEGVCEMIMFTADYLEDPEISNMMDSINTKLGMSPAACQRFRKLAKCLAQRDQ